MQTLNTITARALQDTDTPGKVTVTPLIGLFQFYHTFLNLLPFALEGGALAPQ